MGSQDDRTKCAELLLLLNTYKEEDATLESNDIMKKYKEAADMNSRMEDVFVAMARYYDKIMNNCVTGQEERFTKRTEFIHRVILNLGEAMRRGSKNIYRTMPRFLTLWMDLTAESEDRNTIEKVIIKQNSQL